MIYRFIHISVIILFFSSFSIAQSDTALINWQKLTHKDIEQIGAADAKNTTVQSLNRREESADALPYTMYIVRKDEIRQMGYSTLVDVLKRIPGVKISKNGSAVLGEMFSVRGQLGNQSMKVFINGIPITNSNLAGITIGAQLPIKDAEQIEIIFNNTCTQGLNTVVGTINIVTIQSDRPAYTSASIKYGTSGYSEINTFFGGKFGRGKKIFNFSVYGNFTTYEKRNDYWQYSNAWIFNPFNYTDDIDTTYMEDIRVKLGYASKYGLNNQFTDVKPHTSQSIGGVLQYKNFQFSFDQLRRRDHSSLGYQPAAVSSANPSNYFGESQAVFNITWKKNWKKFGLEAKALLNNYNEDQVSSIRYIHPFLFKRLMYNLVEDYKKPKDESYEKLDLDYFGGNRSQELSSLNKLLSVNYNFKMLKNILVNGGISLASNESYFTNYILENQQLFTSDFESGSTYSDNYTHWINIVYQKNRFYVNASLKNDFVLGSFINESLASFNQYRFAASYRILNKNYVYANTSKSMNLVPAFYYHQNQTFSNVLENQSSNIDKKLDLQKNVNHEIGIRGLDNHFNFDIFKWHQNWILEGQASVFSNSTNMLFENKLYRYLTTQGKYYEAILNLQDPNSYLHTRGIQYNATLKNFFNKKENYIMVSGSYSRYQRKYLENTTDYLAEVPNFIQQYRLSFMASKNITIVADMTVYGKTPFANLTPKLKNLIKENFVYSNVNEKFQYEFKRRNNLDILVQYRFSSNFQAYLKITNFLENEMMGLSNIVNPNDNLYYVPQSHAMSWIGLNYTLD